MKFILFIISFCGCIAGGLKQTAAPVACFVFTTITMPEYRFHTNNNDISPSYDYCTSPAQFNFFAGLLPNNIQTIIRDYCYADIFESHPLLSNIRHSAYLLHIHPSHSIW